MKLKLKLGLAVVCLTFSTGCSFIVELIPPVFNFALGFYDHNDYYSKVSRNNDIYKEVCEEHKSMADKMKAKATRVMDKTLMAIDE